MSEPAQTLASHHAWLRRLARRLVRSEAAAEDLVQETCETALRKPPPDERMRPWLRGVMRNLAWHHVRSEHRRLQREESFQHSTSAYAVPDALLDYGVDRDRLLQLVETLPEPFRSTVVHRFLEGLSCAEIARAEGVPAGTVRWRQSRALELLRARLDGCARPGRSRRRLAVCLPFAALGERLAERAPALLLAGRSRAMMVLAAAAALVVGLALRGDPDQRVTRARASTAALLPGGSAAGWADSGGGAAMRGRGPGAGPRLVRAGSAEAASLATAGWGADGEAERRRRRGLLDRLRDAYEAALYDCAIDRDSVLRCEREAVDAETAGGATCQVLVRSLDALDLARNRRARSPHPGGFLAAAALANRSLAHRLGCSVVADRDADGHPPSGGGGGAARDRDGDREPVCESHTGPGGEECTTCTDETGPHTACSPVDCRSTTEQDGEICTTCTDAQGRAETTCADGWSPSECTSVLQSYGLVCSTCAGGGAAAPECLVADCHVIDSCLECTDPKGRAATDCSIDYELLPTASTGYGGGDTYDVCGASYGFPGGASATCKYPGIDTCRYTRSGDASCVDCSYPDGGGTGACVLDDSLPEFSIGRPSGLPPPGQCITETGPDGAPRCSTCTRADLAATKVCRFPPADFCDVAHTDNPIEKCLACNLVGGGTAAICDGAGS